VAIAVALLGARFGLPLVAPDFTLYAVLSGLVGGIAIVVWWLFFSRAPWLDRLGAVVLMIAAIFAMWPLTHVSIATGAMGMILPILAIPGLGVALVAAAAVSRNFATGPRRATMAVAILLACGVWTLVRTGGFTGNFDNDLAWRWSPTPEERLLAQEEGASDAAPVGGLDADRVANLTPATIPDGSAGSAGPAAAEHRDEAGLTSSVPPTASAATLDWPGFRGPNRDSHTRGVRIETDWAAAPPVELWRRPIGPGWSSFAVRGDVFYTQEQRGEEEVVAAYRVSTGEPVWKHRDPARFWESNGGAGPRATPTLSNGRVYAFGATGILNALDAADGRLVWSRNVRSDSQTQVPDWGFSSSPLIVGDVIIVAAAGKLVAYNVATGAPRWSEPGDDGGYSSPHLSVIHGVPQVLLIKAQGVESVDAVDGKRLWQHSVNLGAAIVQPAVTTDGDVLIGGDSSLHRIAVRHQAGWSAEERWMTNRLKPYFNDFVVHNGHAFGFDGAILTCVNLVDGTRKWKGGRYGNGQLILLSDQDVLLVLSEEGELALVQATTEKFTELARVPAIEGKTWNHPVLVGDVLLVRNGQEMAAFRLASRK
jgi:outer membrane protein assembly factor BamB